MSAVPRQGFGVLAILIATAATNSSAIPIDPREINLAAGSFVVDAEVAMMSRFVGPDTSILSYAARVDAYGWQGRLTGNYAGYGVAIDYTGVNNAGVLPGTREIAFNSSGVFTCMDPAAGCTDNLAWYDEGTWLYGNEVDPPVKTKASLGPKLDANGKPIGFQIQGGIGNGVWSISADVEKDFAAHLFTATVTGAVLDGLASAGGSFSYNQAGAAQDPGVDRSELFAQVLFGLWKWKKTVNTSRVISPPVEPPPGEVPAPPPALPPQDLAATGTLPPVPDPAQDSLGFADNAALPAAEEYMYVQNQFEPVPEPGSLVLVFAALTGLVGVRRYATSSATRTSAACGRLSDRSSR